MKIFIGLCEIAGHYSKLKEGFDEIGIRSIFIDWFDHPFSYEQTVSNKNIIKIIRRLHKKLLETKKLNFFLIGWLLFFRVILFIYDLLRYDVFIFGFDSSFLNTFDLPILKFLNKKIIYRFHGNDCRPPYLSGNIAAAGKSFDPKECIRKTYRKKKFLKKVERYADIIISNPLFSHFLERPFISATHIGLPFKINTKPNHDLIRTTPGCRIKSNIRILHAPSNPEVKGTDEIRNIVKELVSNEHTIEYVEIKGQSNEVVLKELARCDFIIDQLYSDTPMAAFAAEAAFFAKPAVVGGYAKEEFRKIYAPGKVPPSMYFHPNHVKNPMKKLIENRDLRLNLGTQAKQFLDNNWNPQKVAQNYQSIIEDNIPPGWWFDPNDIRYVYGSGLPENRIRKVIRSIVKIGGKQALQLSDKPFLEKKLLEFAYSDTPRN